MRRAYIAEYLDPDTEIILFRAGYWSPELSAQWGELCAERRLGAPMLQGWYVDDNQVNLIAERRS